jgi:hypothetical protein
MFQRPIAQDGDQRRDADESDVVVRQNEITDLDTAAGDQRLIGA